MYFRLSDAWFAALPIGGYFCFMPVLSFICGLSQDWLSRYGYLPPVDPRTSKLQSREGIESAIRVMQRFGGVQETGMLGKNLPPTLPAVKMMSFTS